LLADLKKGWREDANRAGFRQANIEMAGESHEAGRALDFLENHYQRISFW